jgi:protein-tyrosine phosphatase
MDRRTFLLAAVANGALAAAPAAFAATPLEGRASRLSPQSVRLDWSAKEPVSIYQSANPDAPRQAMSRVKTAVTGGAELPAAVSPRPYFLLETKGGQQTRVAERLLPLEGGRNFRDIGGYRTADGRQVRWGKIYRSGVMSGLTVADMTYLSKLGVSLICDLRSPQERNAEPTPFLKVDGVEVIAIDYNMDMSLGGLTKMQTRDQAIQGFAQAYVGFLDILTPHYTELFAQLAAGKAPLAFNCSAGKDRTGMGTALVLSVLGVPRETIVADYALTQVYTPPSMYKAQMASGAGARMGGMTAEQMQAFARMPPEVLDVMMGSDPGVMRLALAEVDRKYGGPIALAKAKFGLTDGKVAAMRKAYLV